MRRGLAAFVSGLLFSVGLAISGMTRPSKVLAFLDLSHAWDPSLALVMLGAVATYAAIYRWSSLRLERPFLADRFARPTATGIDRRLVFGAALFGAGWGVAGYCPGPAIAALGAGVGPAAYFAIPMVAGLWLAQQAMAWSQARGR
jgi:uncharacterized membrane protein YedE/YeeE